MRPSKIKYFTENDLKKSDIYRTKREIFNNKFGENLIHYKDSLPGNSNDLKIYHITQNTIKVKVKA